MLPTNLKLAIVYSKENNSKQVFDLLSKHYNFVDPEHANTIVCLGGDGFMLHTLHNYNHLNVPFYGINCGHLGFLMNEHSDLINLANNSNNTSSQLGQSLVKYLISKILSAHSLPFNPLSATLTNTNHETLQTFAFNEVSLLRSEGVACNLRVSINNVIKLNKLTCDGILTSTPLGSTAYNKACGGPPLPLTSNLMALTAINPFKPAFKSAILLDDSEVKIEILNNKTRPVNIFCDFIKHENIQELVIVKATSHTITLLFDNNNNLLQKTLNAQFSN